MLIILMLNILMLIILMLNILMLIILMLIILMLTLFICWFYTDYVTGSYLMRVVLKKKNSIQNIIPPDDFLELADASYFDADSEAT